MNRNFWQPRNQNLALTHVICHGTERRMSRRPIRSPYYYRPFWPRKLVNQSEANAVGGLCTDSVGTAQVGLCGTFCDCTVFRESFERSGICLERQRRDKLISRRRRGARDVRTNVYTPNRTHSRKSHVLENILECEIRADQF